MKKIISTILFIALFIPFTIFAEVTSYEKLDIRVNFEDGKKVSEMQYSIYASTNEDENLIERTSEFTSEVSYFKLLEDGSREEVQGEYMFKNGETYGFNIDIKPNNNAKLNLDASKILVNSVEQSLKLDFDNESNSINIEYYPKIEKVDKEEVKEEPTDEGSTIANDIIKKDSTCVFGLSMCCKEYKGISYCIIGIAGIVALIFIIFVFNLIIDKKEDKKYKDF